MVQTGFIKSFVKIASLGAALVSCTSYGAADEVTKSGPAPVMNRSYLTEPLHNGVWNDNDPGSGQVAAGVVEVAYNPLQIYPVLVAKKKPVMIVLPEWETIGSLNMDDDVGFRVFRDETKEHVFYVAPSQVLGRETSIHIIGGTDTGRYNGQFNRYSFIVRSLTPQSAQKSDLQYILYDTPPDSQVDGSASFGQLEQEGYSMPTLYGVAAQDNADVDNLLVSPGPVEPVDNNNQSAVWPVETQNGRYDQIPSDAANRLADQALQQAQNREELSSRAGEERVASEIGGHQSLSQGESNGSLSLSDTFNPPITDQDQVATILTQEQSVFTMYKDSDIRSTVFRWAEEAGMPEPLWKTEENYSIDVTQTIEGPYSNAVDKLLSPYTKANPPLYPILDSRNVLCVISPAGSGTTNLTMSDAHVRATEACGAMMGNTGEGR